MDKIDVTADSWTFKIDGIHYIWSGGLGQVMKSRERGLRVGDLRQIGNIVFKVYKVSEGSSYCVREVSWIPNFRIDFEWVRNFKASLIGIPQWMFKEKYVSTSGVGG